MKARTAAAKRRLRKGRPRIENIERQPNGQPSRKKSALRKRDSMSAAEAKSVVIERRIRQDNLVPLKGKDGKIVTAEEQADSPYRGYPLGLLYLDGKITANQHEAGLRYEADVIRYLGLKGLPMPTPRAKDIFSVIGFDGDESESRVDRAKRAEAIFGKLRLVLLSVGDIDTGRKVERAVAEVCVRNTTETRMWPDHMIVLLKRGLNSLSFHYGLQNTIC